MKRLFFVDICKKKKNADYFLIIEKCLESAAAARKDSTPPIDAQKPHGVDVGGNAYTQEHESAPSSMLQAKDDAGNPDQVTASFGDMNISVPVNKMFFEFYLNYGKNLRKPN